MIKISKYEDGREKLSVECYAVVKQRHIQVFLDSTIPGYMAQLKQYEDDGFTIVLLTGSAEVKKSKLTFTKKEVIEKLDPYFMKESIDVIVRKLGF